MPERFNASGPDILVNGRRHDGLEPGLLKPEVLAVVRLRLAAPPPLGGLWSSREVADVIAVHLGLKRVRAHLGWEVLKASTTRLSGRGRETRSLPRPRRRRRSREAGRAVTEEAADHPDVAVEMFCTDEHRLGLKPITRAV